MFCFQGPGGLLSAWRGWCRSVLCLPSWGPARVPAGGLGPARFRRPVGRWARCRGPLSNANVTRGPPIVKRFLQKNFRGSPLPPTGVKNLKKALFSAWNGSRRWFSAGFLDDLRRTIRRRQDGHGGRLDDPGRRADDPRGLDDPGGRCSWRRWSRRHGGHGRRGGSRHATPRERAPPGCKALWLCDSRSRTPAPVFLYPRARRYCRRVTRAARSL